MTQPASDPGGRDSEAPTVEFPAPAFPAPELRAPAFPAPDFPASDFRAPAAPAPVPPTAGHPGAGADTVELPERGAEREPRGRPEGDGAHERGKQPERDVERERPGRPERDGAHERGGERDGPPPAEWDPLAHGGAAGWRTVLGVLLVLGGVLGATLLVLAMMRAPTPPPQPTAAQAPPSAVVAPPAPSTSATPAPSAAAPLPPSTPVRIDVARAHIHAPIIATGLDADDTVAVPPIDHPYLTGWYDRSVTPGQSGAAVLLGHVDSHRTGPAVFYYLGALTRGDTVQVTRADHTVAVFTVDGVAGYEKTRFPATAVYGPTAGPSLRLVTCGGRFDERTHSYERNVVVFASLTSSHRETAAEAARPLQTTS
ncbi:hypothetical protein Athai_18080 [Actinocatenispora thailandica]|uniref:Class F sortase n=1 Tax=Actinocatenispora thailandica TaxID=227318 RepID=A0A7R7DMB6_9ACTN|nr:class F sortase [Actinocatenispora thailandica]BCJ34305.1 hypothetical protein Athai_18080 [Actinocatenispora thailandica]